MEEGAGLGPANVVVAVVGEAEGEAVRSGVAEGEDEGTGLEDVGSGVIEMEVGAGLGPANVVVAVVGEAEGETVGSGVAEGDDEGILWPLKAAVAMPDGVVMEETKNWPGVDGDVQMPELNPPGHCSTVRLAMSCCGQFSAPASLPTNVLVTKSRRGPG
jgi:hypothetical protein